MNSLLLLTANVLTGRDDNFIDHASLERPVHQGIVSDWRALCAAAAQYGFQLEIASGYRNYQRQLQIWNAKADGERAVLAADGSVLDISCLSERERVLAILRWSALPGASRHHWGTDIDIFDRAAVSADYVLQLTQEESDDAGPFGAMHRWLDERIATNTSFGFFRPYPQRVSYEENTIGVAAERWHLSYAPLAARYQRNLKPDTLWQAIDSPSLRLRSTIAEMWPEIFEKYVWVSPQYYPAALRERFAMASDDV